MANITPFQVSVGAKFFVLQNSKEHDYAGFDTLQARQWLDTRKNSHPRCSDLALQESPLLPIRILDVNPQANPAKIRLHQSQCEEKADYACLSYAWGGPQPMMLSKSSLQSFRDAIMVDQLPPRLKDAEYTTRALGLKFLWIDALCIIQDSEDDKAKELGRMHQYYRNSNLCLQLSGLSSVQESFLDCGKPSPKSTSEAELGCRRTVPFQSADGKEDTLMVELSPKRWHEPSQPLSQRAWAL